MNDWTELRQAVVGAGKRLLAEGLVARTWGNVSVRAGPDHMLITPSGRAYESMAPEDIVPVNLRTGAYDGPLKPSSEGKLHAEIYRTRSEIHAVIHTHQMNASTVAAARREVPPILDDMVQIIGPTVRVADYCPAFDQQDCAGDGQGLARAHGRLDGQPWRRLPRPQSRRGIRGLPGPGEGLQGLH